MHTTLPLAPELARQRRAQAQQAVLARRLRAVARAERRARRATLRAQRARVALQQLR